PYFNQYKNSFSQGEYNIKERANSTLGGPVIKTYFSGGFDATNLTMSSSSVGSYEGKGSVTDALFAANNAAALGGNAKDLIPELKEATGSSSLDDRDSKATATKAQLANYRPAHSVDELSKIISPTLEDSLTDIGLQVKSFELEALPLPGRISQDMPTSLTAEEVEMIKASLATSLLQAVGTTHVAYIEQVTENRKSLADNISLTLGISALKKFTAANPNIAIVSWGSEGPRDGEWGLPVFTIIYQGQAHSFKNLGDARANRATFKRRLNQIKKQNPNVRFRYLFADALEVTNGIKLLKYKDGKVIDLRKGEDANSWSVASVFKDARNPEPDKEVRRGGTSYSSPERLSVTPFTLPSQYYPKLARAHGVDYQDKGAMAEFMSNQAMVVLWKWSNEEDKDPRANHRVIYNDGLKLQEKYPGFRVLGPGDGDFFWRLASIMGLKIDGRMVSVFGRSGSVEGRIADEATALFPQAHFESTRVSPTGTKKQLTAKSGHTYNLAERNGAYALGLNYTDLTEVTSGKGFGTNTGAIALTSINDPLEGQFGSDAGLFKGVEIDTTNPEAPVLTMRTLLITPMGPMVAKTRLVSPAFSQLGQSITAVSDGVKNLVITAEDSFQTASSALTQIQEKQAAPQRKSMVIANWKMEQSDKSQVMSLIDDIAVGIYRIDGATNIETVVAPSFVYLDSAVDYMNSKQDYTGGVKVTYNPIGFAAQNMYGEEKGPFTGGISAKQLADLGVPYVILGHSELRRNSKQEPTGESNRNVNKKTKTAFKYEITPIVCVGESFAERKAGNERAVVEEMVRNSLAGLSYQDAEKATVAYEPVWAIGTGEVATPEQAQEMHRFIREILAEMFGWDVALKIRILYGGSVKPENAAKLIAKPDVDGFLIGGASLKAESFLDITKKVVAAQSSSSLQAATDEDASLRSASIPNKNMGGIDFRVINTITRPMGNLSGLSFAMPKMSSLRNINLDTELNQIQNMLEAEITPSEDRLKEFVVACYQRGELREHLDEIVMCLVDTFDLQAARGVLTPDGLKELVLIIDAIAG
ncbi:MAG: triose-phosphate isomerase, partial [Candidatus Omnitrophota bacterium]